MKRIAILMAVVAATTFGGFAASAQVVANEYVMRFYSDSSYQEQVGEFVQNCDGSTYSWGMVTADSITDYYGC